MSAGLKIWLDDIRKVIYPDELWSSLELIYSFLKYIPHSDMEKEYLHSSFLSTEGFISSLLQLVTYPNTAFWSLHSSSSKLYVDQVLWWSIESQKFHFQIQGLMNFWTSSVSPFNSILKW